METIGNYLLQMACWLAGFWVLYVLLLRHETFFKLNRWFLLSGLVLSVLMPLFPLRYAVEIAASQSIELEASGTLNSAANTLPHKPLNYWLIAYVAGLLIFVIRFIWQTLRLYLISKSGEKVKMGSTRVLRLEMDTAPFSFFRTIYVSKKLSGDTELKAVIAHEKVHIDERHWADLLMLEMVRALQWFNPLLIFYRKAMMQNHEYLADMGTIQKGVSARTYQAILVNQMLGVPVLRIANGFTLFNPTKRIFMMNKNKTTPIKKLRLLWALPLMALLLAAFAKPNYVASENDVFVIVNDENTLMVKGKVSNEKGEALHGASIIVAGSHYGTITDANGNFALDAVVQGSDIVISFVGYETVKAKAQANLDVKLKRSIIGIDLVAAKPKAKVTTKQATGSKNPLILVDGKTFEGDINSIDQNNIEKMEVFKVASATKIYGDKGKNGVVLVTTKKQVQASPNDEIFVVVEDMPEFKGGTQALKSYIDQSTAGSKEKGAVQVTFTVTTDGSLDNIKVVSSPSKTLSSKTIAIMKAMPAWKPGKQRGKAISVDYSLKLEFQ